MRPYLWVDGRHVTEIDHAIAATSRGLHYGDGLFETMALSNGRVRLLKQHLERLTAGCTGLGISPPAHSDIESEISAVASVRAEGIIKLVVIRSGEGRGYRPDPHGASQRLLYLYERGTAPSELRVRWCKVRWSRNPQLAGIKHLNRLEQVLAQAELHEHDEGLMLDTEDQVVSGTAGNLFAVIGGRLCTPTLDECGIRGVMRGEVIRVASACGVQVEERIMTRDDVTNADELFITNAVRGIRPVIALDGRSLQAGPVTLQLMHAVLQT